VRGIRSGIPGAGPARSLPRSKHYYASVVGGRPANDPKRSKPQPSGLLPDLKATRCARMNEPNAAINYDKAVRRKAHRWDVK
jgi:hypothetical protein